MYCFHTPYGIIILSPAHKSWPPKFSTGPPYLASSTIRSVIHRHRLWWSTFSLCGPVPIQFLFLATPLVMTALSAVCDGWLWWGNGMWWWRSYIMVNRRYIYTQSCTGILITVYLTSLLMDTWCIILYLRHATKGQLMLLVYATLCIVYNYV